MSFIKESKNAYKQVQENHIAIAMGKMLDDEGSMILNQLEELERAIEMIRTYIGADYEKQLPAWVQSKVTLGSDYISTVGNYLSSKNEKATEEAIKEEFDLEEATLTSIHKMKEDGKTAEEIAKELKLNAGLVKKILGEEVELKEFTDLQIDQLKKEFDPLKGKQIGTARANQLSNILDKLDDGSLDKLKSALIPFVSALAAVKTTQRKMRGVKITNIKVPGLEGMAEEATFWWHDGKSGYVKAGYDNKELLAWLKKNGYKPEKDIKEEMAEDTANPGDAVLNMAKRLGLDNYGYARYGKDNVVTHRQVGGMLQKLDKPFKLDKPIKKEEVELKPVPSLEDSAKKHNVDIETLKKQLEKGIEIEKEHTKDDKVAEKIALAHIDERPDYYIQINKLEKKPVEKVDEVKEPTGDLKDACWTGYVAIGTKMKNGKRVPNCVPKSEAYKGAKKIVENAFKKLKEKK
jgi:hypothetical protein